MQSNLFGNLFKKLIENEFSIINGFYDKNEIDEKSRFAVVYKVSGNYIYCIALINEKVCDGECESLIENIKIRSEKIFDSCNDGKILFLNIVITENAGEDSIKTLEKFRFDYEKERNDLCWVLDEEKRRVFCGSGEPVKILNIDRLIQEAFSERYNYEKTDFYSISRDIEKEQAKALKSKDNNITFLLIIINVFVFALMELSGGSENTNVLISFGAAVPELIYKNNEYFRLFTSMFVHIGYAHIFSNCLSLYILGTRSEKYFGKALFFIIYILSGLGASVLSLILAEKNSISAGASGAIFGIMGAMLVYSILKKQSIGGFSGYFMVLFSLINLSAGFFVPGIDNAGHIGGFLMGAGIVFVMKLFSVLYKHRN